MSIKFDDYTNLNQLCRHKLFYQNEFGAGFFRLFFIKNNYRVYGNANYFQLQSIKKSVLSFIVV